MPTGKVRRQRRAATRADRKARAPGAQYNAVVVYERDKAGAGGFYLDSVVVGTREAAEVELAAAEAAPSACAIRQAFLAPVTAGFHGLAEPLKKGHAPTEFNVWLMRRDGADGLREYEVKLTKRAVGDAPPDHDPNMWLCTQIGEGWQRPDHLALHHDRTRARAARLAIAQ